MYLQFKLGTSLNIEREMLKISFEKKNPQIKVIPVPEEDKQEFCVIAAKLTDFHEPFSHPSRSLPLGVASLGSSLYRLTKLALKIIL